MLGSLRQTTRHMAGVLRRLKGDRSGELPMDAGFSFSAWFFVALVALTFLDAYVFRGRGIGFYMNVPAEIIAKSPTIGNG